MMCLKIIKFCDGRYREEGEGGKTYFVINSMEITFKTAPYQVELVQRWVPSIPKPSHETLML